MAIRRRRVHNGEMKRTLFSLAVVLLTASLSPAEETVASQSAAEKLGWQLAVHSYTFRLFSIFDAVDRTAACGIKSMSISGNVNLQKGVATPTAKLTDEAVASIESKMKAAGIAPKFVNMGVVSLQTDEAKDRVIFEAAKKMGIDVLVAEPPEAALDTVEKLAKEYNIKVAIHDHPKPSHYWNPDTVLAAVKGRSPLIGACADTGHWVRSGLDPVECLKKLEGRVICLHFKDLSEKSPKAHDVPWGTGISNAKGMMAELKRQGFKGAFCVEYEYKWEDSVPEITQCAKFFNATCAELVKTP